MTEEILQNLREKAQRYLPESTVLEFLMNVKSPMLKDIREYVDLAELVPFIRLYNGNDPNDRNKNDYLFQNIYNIYI